MSYDANEILGGEPVELFKFIYGATSWFWTSGDESISKDGDVYLPIAIVSGNVSADNEAQANSVEIKIGGNNELAALFANNQPLSKIFVTIFRKQRGDVEFISVFVGEVAVCSFTDTEAALNCVPTQAASQRKLAVLKYQPTCNNRLFDSRCQVDKATFTYTYPIVSIMQFGNETRYEIGGGAAVFFVGDKLNWMRGGTAKFGNQVLMVEEQSGIYIYTLGILDDAVAGDDLIMTAGCDKLVATCRDKFDNLPRFQGFPYAPTANPAKPYLTTIGAGFPFFGNPGP